MKDLSVAPRAGRVFQQAGNRTLPVALLIAVVVFGHPAIAHAQGKPGENKGAPSGAQNSASQSDPLIEFARRWDINQDGTYTCEEWRIFMTGVFRKADRNRSKAVESAEFTSITSVDKVFAGAAFSYFDVDDGKIDLAELVEGPNPFFARHDADKDCVVSEAELARSGPTGPRNAGQKSGDLK